MQGQEEDTTGGENPCFDCREIKPRAYDVPETQDQNGQRQAVVPTAEVMMPIVPVATCFGEGKNNCDNEAGKCTDSRPHVVRHIGIKIMPYDFVWYPQHENVCKREQRNGVT